MELSDKLKMIFTFPAILVVLSAGILIYFLGRQFRHSRFDKNYKPSRKESIILVFASIFAISCLLYFLSNIST